MLSRSKCSLLSLALTLASTPILAQGGSSSAPASYSGTTSALAFGFSRTDKHPSNGRDEVYIKSPGSTGGVAVATPTTQVGARSYPLQELFGVYASEIRIASWSTGCSMIPDRASGGNWPDLAHPNAESWMLVVLSVSDGTQGTSGSLIEQRRSNTIGRSTPGADLYGWYMSHSTGISESLTGTLQLEMYAEELGMGDGGDIDALDYGMGVITHNQTHPSFVFFRNDDDLFFTLEQSCLAAINALAGNDFANGLPADTSTIYRIQHNGSAWQDPTIYRDSLQLGIVEETEIDALVVDALQDNLVFSPRVGLGLPQLLYYDGNGAAVELADGDGTPVSEKAGVESNDVTGEVDGLDVLDPESGVFGNCYGTGQGSVLPDSGDVSGEGHGGIGISVTRSHPDADGDPVVHLQATGWGSDDATDGFVVFQVRDPYDLGVDGYLDVSGWTSMSPVSRSASQYAVDLAVPVPALYFTNPLGVRAIMYDSDGIETGSSWAAVFNL